MSEKIFHFVLFALLVLCLLNMQASAKQLANEEDKKQVRRLVKEAIEDDHWLKTATYRELHACMSRYFTGNLLRENTNLAWKLICTDTDWYIKAQVEKIIINSIDENKASVLAYIRETDLTATTTLRYKLSLQVINTESGWRIKQLDIINDKKQVT